MDARARPDHGGKYVQREAGAGGRRPITSRVRTRWHVGTFLWLPLPCAAAGTWLPPARCAPWARPFTPTPQSQV